MKIKHFRLISDIHLEFADHLVEPSITDNETLLVLAGDIHVGIKAVDFIVELSSRFPMILYILGNHEFYYNNFATLEYAIDNEIQRRLSKINSQCQVIVAGNEPKQFFIDKVRVFAGTLWTDMNDNDPMTKHVVQYGLNDYRVIKNDNKALTVEDTMAVFHNTVSQFVKWIKEPFNGKTLIFTHHAPTLEAVDVRYKDSVELNGGFASNLEKFIWEYQPAFWGFGHLHNSVKMKIGKTKVQANAKGYPKRFTFADLDSPSIFENTKFKDKMITNL